MVSRDTPKEGGVVVVGDDAGAPYRIRFGVLGPLQVLRDGNPVGVGGAQQRAVLAFLLIQRERTVSVEEIADALWRERPPPGYAPTIQSYVFRLREALEPDRVKGEPPAVLVTEPGGYRLKIDPGAIDVADFERLLESGEGFAALGRPTESAADLTSALSLWRGPVLADLAGYDFVGQLGRRLDELRLRAVEARIDAGLALGRHASIIAEVNSLAEAYPLREHVQAQRILALYRAGRQADALAAFRSVRARMMNDLGIEPGTELTNLHQSVLNHDAGLQLDRPLPPLSDAESPQVADSTYEARNSSRVHRVSRRLIGATVVSAVVLAGITGYRTGSRPSSRGPLPANSLVRIDADGSFHDAVAVGVDPDGVAVVGGAAWVSSTSANSTSKIDLQRHQVVQTTIVQAAPQALTVSGSDLWVVNGGAASVSRLNLKTAAVVQTVTVGNQPSAIAAGNSGIWVVNTGDDTVIRIDPATGTPDKPIAVGFRPAGIAVDSTTVWVSNTGDGTVSPIDSTSHAVGSPIAVGSGPAGIAVSDGAVWVANSLSQTVSRIDPVRRRVAATIGVGDGPQSVARVGKLLWVANEFDGTVVMIDQAENRVLKRIATGASVRGLVSDGKYAYATTRSLVPAKHRGGTLHVTTGLLPDVNGIDPSNADTEMVFEAFSLVYDGLVGLQRTGGSAGLTLVPDLALDLPRPSDGGLTYTFRLRRGIHYSNGAEVRPDDIRRGLQQEITMTGDPDRLANIVGAPACIRVKTVCDLSRGVVTNADSFEVTFHLRAPDPDFLYKLTEPLFATPEGEPGVPASTPRPATGPYMIAEHGDGTTFTLVRNPKFHVWSVAAQPPGYPDKIEWTPDPDPSHAVRSVLTGETDADERAAFATLQRIDPANFHSDFTARLHFMFLNTHIAPFDNADARKAINYAVDRDTIVDLIGGTSFATPTCQIVPPNFPGYRRYCPYTANRTPDGRYHGPDFTKALALVDGSGTRGEPVTVVSSFSDEISVSIGEYIAHVLTKLGYKAKFALVSDNNYFSSANPAQIGLENDYMDYPTPAVYLGTLRCSSGWAGGYCNHHADNLFLHALQTQRIDTAKSRTEWTTLDRTLTDDGAWLSLYNEQSMIVLSDRVGNYLCNPKYGPLYGQMWVVS